MDGYLGSFMDPAITVNGGMDDSVVEIQYPLLRFFVPRARVCLVRLVEFGVGAERGEERGFIVR